MIQFTIKQNDFLSKEIEAFSHTDYIGYDRRDEIENYPMYLLTLKNDVNRNWRESLLKDAQKSLLAAISSDLPEIIDKIEPENLTVCVVPRAKKENSYRKDQLLFKETIRIAVNKLGDDFIDGTQFISRHTNTKTTHLRRPIDDYDNDGSEPYPGISGNTCNFSENLRGRDILLIDDIYTENINIDEDMIQALLDCEANSVTFYAVEKTIH